MQCRESGQGGHGVSSQCAHHITRVRSVDPGIIIIMAIMCTRSNTENRNGENQITAAIFVVNLTDHARGDVDVRASGDHHHDVYHVYTEQATRESRRRESGHGICVGQKSDKLNFARPDVQMYTETGTRRDESREAP